MLRIATFLFAGFVIFLQTGCGPAPVRISNFSPSGEVPLSATFGFKFNQRVVPDSLTKIWTQSEILSFSPPIEGYFNWVKNDSLLFSPGAPLIPAQDYSFSVGPDFFHPPGRAVDTLQYHFHTPPFVPIRMEASWRDPSDYGFMNFPALLKLTFSHAVEEGALKEYFSLECNGIPVEELDFPYSWSVEKNQRQIGFVPPPNVKSPLQLSLKVRAGLPAEQFEKALLRDTVLTASLPGKDTMEVLSAETEIQMGEPVLRISMNQPFHLDSLAKHLHFTPTKDFIVQQSGIGVMVKASFSPMEKISMVIDSGWKGNLGGKLTKVFQKEIKFPVPNPSLEFEDAPGMYLSKNGLKNIGVVSRGVDSFLLEVVEIFENNVTHFARREGNPWVGRYNESYLESFFDEEGYGRLIQSKRIGVNPSGFDWNRVLVNLEPTLGKRFLGIYALRITSDQDYWIRDAKLVSLSDLGLIARKTEKEMGVWVQSIGSGLPLGGVEVALLSSNNQTLANGTTDGQGFVKFSGLEGKTKGFEPRLISVKKGGDYNFLDLEHAKLETGVFDLQGPSPWNKEQAYLIHERNLYRPGDTAHLAAIIRDRNWKPIPVQPFILRVSGPAGEVISETRHTTDPQGSFEWEGPIPVFAPTGRYDVDLLNMAEQMLANSSFQVEEFVPDRIRVWVRPLQDSLRPGDTLRIPLEAAYYFGTACANHSYSYTIGLEEQNYYCRKFSEFRFNSREPESGIQFSQENEGLLDGEGKDTLEYVIPTDLTHPGYYQGKIVVEVKDKGGQVVSRGAQFHVWPWDYYVGMKMNDAFINVGSAAKMDFIVVAPSGKPLSGIAIPGAIYRTEWTNYYEKNQDEMDYSSHRELVPLDSFSLLSKASGPVSLTWKVKESGFYEVEYQQANSGGELTHFYGFGKYAGMASNFGVEKEGTVEISSDKEKYKTGETARISFKTPFSGKMLVTFERDQVFGYKYVDV